VLTPVDDVDALAGGIKTVLGSSELREKMIANGRARVAREFSESAVVAQYAQTLQNIVMRKRAG
jgi:glycosyltransferase involved in cell wall biosynthesis